MSTLDEKTLTTSTPEKIIISGKTDAPKAFEYLNFLDYSYFFGTNHKGSDIENFGDSLAATLDSIKVPQLLELMAIGDTTSYITRIFVTPGDSVFMKMEDEKIQFYGENEAHYNFYRKMDSVQSDWPGYEGDLKKFKDQTKLAYKKRKAFFEEYIKKNKNNISDDFISKVGAEIRFQYLYNLIKPNDLTKPNGFEADFNVNSRPNMASLINAEMGNQEELLDLGDYFDNVSIEEFKRPELINNDYFKRTLIFYIRYYFSNPDYVEYSRENFLAEKDFIIKHLEGDLETFAIGRLIHDYYQKGFGVGKSNIRELSTLIEEYEDRFAEVSPTYIDEINVISDGLKYHGLPENVMNEQLLSLKGDTIQFKDVLEATDSKIKTIDFWATWCPPCLRDIRSANEFKKRLATEDNVAWIYLSADRNKNDWTKVSKELKEFFGSPHQYLILNPRNSKLLKFIKVNDKGWFTVPRYTVLDADNNIILNNAPKPSDTLVFKKVIDEINSK